jgi:hypothetical protein
MLALNDLLPRNERLTEERDDELPPHERLYLARLVGSHLFELATFLDEAARRFPEIEKFLDGLPDEAQHQRHLVVAVAKGKTSDFAEKLERLRNHFMHYPGLITGAPEREELSKALVAHADREGEIRVGELLKDFRAHFADDVAAELTLSEEDAEPFVGEMADLSIAATQLAYAVIGAYTAGLPDGTFETIRS